MEHGATAVLAMATVVKAEIKIAIPTSAPTKTTTTTPNPMENKISTLCVINVDMMVKPKYTRSKRRNHAIHATQKIYCSTKTSITAKRRGNFVIILLFYLFSFHFVFSISFFYLLFPFLL